MSKVTINTITTDYASKTLLNENFSNIQTAIENTLSRDGTSPNTMSANLDMNSNRILNLPVPTSSSEPARYGDIGSYADSASASAALALSYANTASTAAVVATANPSYPEVRVVSHSALTSMTAAQMKAAQCVIRDGFYSGSVLGAARFLWTDTATTPDGYTRIAGSDDPTGSLGALIMVGNPTVADFGCYCDGSTLDDSYLALAVTASASYGYNLIFPPNKTLKVSAAKNFDLGLYSVFGNGSILDFSGLTDGLTAVTLSATSSITPAQIAISVRARHHLTGLSILGPGKAGAGAAYSLTSVGLLINGANIYADHVTVAGFGYGLRYGTSGVYICTVSDCNFTQNRYGVYGPSGGSDYGEKLSIIGGKIDGNNVNISWHIPTGRLSLYDVSIDYPGTLQIENDNSGEVAIFGGWYECNDAGSGSVTYTNSGYLLQFFGTHIQQNGTAGSLSQSALGTTSSGSNTVFSSVFMFNTKNTADILDNGAGSLKISLASSYAVPFIPSSTSSSNNLLYDPGFSSSTIPDLWYVTGGTSVSRLSNTNIVLSQDTSVFSDGSASLKIVKTSAGSSDGFGVIARLRRDSSRVSITGKYHLTAGSNGNEVYCSLVALKFGGVDSYGVPVYTMSSTLATIGLGGSTSAIDWTSFGFSGMIYSIPEWADSVGLYFNAGSFSGTMNLDVMNISLV